MIMAQTMTVRTENSQIIQRIILRVKVFMMNAKNLWMFIISTVLAFFNQISSLKISSNSISLCDFPIISLILISTFLRTVFSFISGSFKNSKFFSTFYTIQRNLFRIISNLSLAFRGTIFSCSSLSNPIIFKLIPTLKTISLNVCHFFNKKVCFSQAFIRTKSGLIFSALNNIKIFIAIFTFFNNSFFMKRFTFSILMVAFLITKYLKLRCFSFKNIFTNRANCSIHKNQYNMSTLQCQYVL